MKSLRKLILPLIAFAIVAALVFAFLPKPVAVDMAKVGRGPLQVTIDEDGKTRIKERYIISAPLAGRLLRIQLKAGDNATANQTLLATLEPRDPDLLDARARAEAEARVSAAKAAWEQSTPTLERTRVMLEQAQKEHDDKKAMLQRGAAKLKEVEDAALLLGVRTQEYNAAVFDQDISRFVLAQARAALVRTQPVGSAENGNSAVGTFEIRAPCDGRVLRVFQESSAVVQAGTPLLEFGDPSDMEAEIDVLSTEAVKISRGASVIIDRWGGEKPLRGTVRVIEPSGFTKRSALGVEEQRVNVIVDFVDPPETRKALGDGYRVEARIIIWEEQDVVKVPTSALFRSEGKWAVFVVSEGKAVTRIVSIGMQTATDAQVLEGLKEGETVILHPSDRVAPGVSVEAR